MEYGLVGAILAVAGLAAFIWFGNNLDAWLTDFKDTIGQHEEAAMSARNGVGSLRGGPSGEGIWDIEIPESDPVTEVCGAGMTHCSMEADPTTETAGSNGGEKTNALVDEIEELIAQMERENADPQLLALLSQLAHSGHGLGDAEKALLDHCPPGTKCGTKGYEGDRVHRRLNQAQRLSRVLGRELEAFRAQQDALNEYLAAHPEALTPQIAEFVKQKADQINQIADTFNELRRQIRIAHRREDDRRRNLDLEHQGDGADKTHQNANDICKPSQDASCQKKPG